MLYSTFYEQDKSHARAVELSMRTVIWRKIIGIIKKKVSMIRKYHNHNPQTNPRHREEESQNIYSNKTSVRQ